LILRWAAIRCLFQHLFLVLLTSGGVHHDFAGGWEVVSEVIPCLFPAKNIFGYHFVAFSSVSIAGAEFFWYGATICSWPGNPLMSALAFFGDELSRGGSVGH